MFKENIRGSSSPLFMRYLNGETGVLDIIISFSKSTDSYTSEAAKKALADPPDLDSFKKELEGAVRDIVKEGPGDEFKAFVNHYMESSLREDTTYKQGSLGESRRQVAYVKDDQSTWIQGFICYNLCLFIKAFGLETLKSCKTCGKLFCNKGKYAVYCTDACNVKKTKSFKKE